MNGMMLFEDDRSVIDKLRSLIDHPSTEETVKDVARAKLEKLLSGASFEEKYSFVHNVLPDQINLTYGGIRVSNILDGLENLVPRPHTVTFLPGRVVMEVYPPFFNITKNQYYMMLTKIFVSVRGISSEYKGNHYEFTITS